MHSSCLFQMATCTKRKRKVLSIEQKLEICQRLRSRASITVLLKEMDIGKSTICDSPGYAIKMSATGGTATRNKCCSPVYVQKPTRNDSSKEKLV